MGLDILHCIAKSEVSGSFCRIEHFMSEMKPREKYFQEYENPHLDWPKMFSARSLAHEDYFLRTRSTDGVHNAFGFVGVSSASINAPIKVIFSDRSSLYGWLPTFMLPPDVAYKGAQKFFGPLATIMKVETVIFYDTVGYQRNSVSDAFYQMFKPDDLTCLKQQVETIHNATLPESREEFRRGFLDNWDEDRSFVQVSY